MSIINHIPSPESELQINKGHFVTYSRRGENWYKLDDAKCRDALLKDVTSPYMLFYEHVPNEDNSDDQDED